jgi:asparagine synthase (glutamine-hydrolysing)
MCGIAGFINFTENKALAERASCVQQHRGPDAQGIWFDNHVAFSHQRLSIIDLDIRSNQPFVKDGLVIIFNGEIYNYKLLKDQILSISPGTSFITNSDTEVLLELYRLKKEKCLDDLIGMFAFAIYETNTGKLFIARDHFGIKPLFYTRIDNAFAFSSELKTLIQIPEFDKALNYNSLIGSINYLWIPGEETMFKNAFKLSPSHYLLIDTNTKTLKIEIHKYWQLDDSIKYSDENDAINELTKTFEKSIQRHMVADVPVSSFLSGGLDSSLISVMAAKINNQLSTYTISTLQRDKQVEQMPEDEKYAKELAVKYHFDHHEILLTPDIVKELPKMVYSLDEPIGDPAAINTYLICKAAREKGVKVLLSGMGADELFFGYRRQKAALISNRYKKLPYLIRKLFYSSVSLLPVKIFGNGIKIARWAKRFLSFAELPLEEAYMRSYSYYNREELQNLFKVDISEPYNYLRRQHAGYFQQLYANDVVNKICFTDINMFMLGLNLTYTDRASMAASVEVRVPFIDKEVIETAMRIGGSLKYKKRQSKYVLKKMAEDYLPKDIIYRPKASFGVPIRSWISTELRPMVDDLLSKGKIEKRGFFNYSYIKQLIDKDRAGIEDNAYRIYQLLTLELWCQKYIDQ